MSSLNTVQSAQKKLTIDFPIQKVKEGIMEIFEKESLTYMIKPENINDVFNTYHFSIVKGMLVKIVDITLVAIDENKTEIDIVITNAYGSIGSNSILFGALNDYLNLLSRVLKGEVLTKNTGCIVLLLIGLSMLGLMAFKLL
jgi:hypothetical protein